MDNKVSIVVGSQDNSKLDLDSLKRKLTDMGKMIETARVDVKGDKEGEIAVERLALKLAALGKKIASPKIGLEGAARAEVDIAAIGLGLDHMGEKAQKAARAEEESMAKAAAAAAATAAEVDAVGVSADRAKEKVGGSGLSGALSRMGKVLGGLGGVAGGALGLGLAGPFAAAGLAAGAFGAVAIPILTKVTTAQGALTTAQAAYNKVVANEAIALGQAGLSAKQKASIEASFSKQKQQALNAEKTATAGLTGSQQGLMGQVGQLKSMWDKLESSMTPVVVGVASMAVKLGSALMPALNQLVPAGAKVLGAVLTPMTKLFQSSFFGSFIDQMTRLASQVAPLLGQQLAALLTVFMQMFMQAGPAAVTVLGQLLPAIVAITSGLVPVVVLVTTAAAAVLKWLNANHLLIPALIAVGAAIALSTGGLSLIIPAIALVVGGLVHLWQTSQTFRNIVTGVFSVVGRAVLTFAELWLDELHIVTNIWLTAVGIIVHGAAAALGWVPGVGPALKLAVRGFDAFKDGVNHVFDAAHTKIEQWKANLANLPKVVRIEGNITDLTNKLHTAVTSLANPRLTATRRSAIVTNIGQLQIAIANARAALDAINGKVATTYVQTIQLQPHGTVPGGRVEHGGITGAASGGMRSALTLVGEHGAELVTLPPGAMVHSNPDTQRMLSGSGGAVQVLVSVDAASFEEAGLSPAQVRNIKATVRHLGGGNVQAAFGYGKK